MEASLALQDNLPSDNPIRGCFGCGADNAHGLHIKSYFDGNEGVATWRPENHHCSYPGYLNGGIACTLIDCHSASIALAVECRERGLDLSRDSDQLPSAWTRAMSVEFLKPVPLKAALTLKARLVSKGRTSRTVRCSIYADGEECITGEVTVVMTGL